MEQQAEASGPEQDEMFAAMLGQLREDDSFGAPQGLVKQSVGLLTGLFRPI